MLAAISMHASPKIKSCSALSSQLDLLSELKPAVCSADVIGARAELRQLFRSVQLRSLALGKWWDMDDECSCAVCG